MAIMERLRKSVFGVFGTIILFIILIVFLWGDASQGSSNMQRGDANVAGTVNGEDITYEEFNARVDAAMEQQAAQAAADGEKPDRATMQEQVWQQMVQERLLFQMAEKYGVAVSDEELRILMYTEPPQQLTGMFTDTAGTFLQQQYNQFLANIDGFLLQQKATPEQAANVRAMVLDAQNNLRLQKTIERMMRLVGSLHPRSPLMMRAGYDQTNTKASGSFVLLSTNLIPDASVTVDKTEVRKYYDDHLDFYKRKPSRVIKYAVLGLGPSSKDSARVQSRFETYIESMAKGTTPEQKDSIFGELTAQLGGKLFKGNTYQSLHELPAEIQDTIRSLPSKSIIGPVSIDGSRYYINLTDRRDSGSSTVKVAHILLSSATDNDSIKALAQQIAERARGGEDFAKLVAEYSQDQGSAQTGGDVGWVNEATNFVPEFKAAALKLDAGEVSDPVKSQFGYHIIKASEKSNTSYKLRALNFDVQISDATRNSLQRTAKKIKQQLEEGMSFDAIGKEHGVKVEESTPIYSPNQPIANTTLLGQFAFSSEINDVSDVRKMPDGSVVVAQLTEINQGGPAPLDDVAEQITALLKNRKKVAMLKERADKIRAGLSPSDSLSKAVTIDSTAAVREFTDATPTGSMPDIGFDPALSAKLFQLKAGELSQPIKGDLGYYIVKLNTISVPTDATYASDKELYEKQGLGQARSSVFGKWFQGVMENASVERNWD